jgi:hypothetical protein
LILATAVVVLAVLSAACPGRKAPNAPGDNSMSRPVSPPSPGVTVGSIGRAPALVAFLVRPLGGIATYGFFVVAIAGAFVGFMDVLGRDEKNRKP